ncbi:MAG TPA: choice-of-anchor D domain-containing protein [bacterium]|nr:choice-of-anchor D domain-containing protein [bacterium]
MKRVFLLAALIFLTAATGLLADFAMDTSLADSDASFWGEAANDHAGWSLSTVGDVNGDGYDDFLIGMYDWEDGSEPGRAYLFLGKASGWAMDTSLADADASFIGEAAGDAAGNCVSGAGDVNGDGYDDFLIGAPVNYEGGNYAGQVYLILGKASGWAMDTSLADSDASFWGEVTWDCLAQSAGAGDVNGDGYDDFILSSSSNSGVGQTYLILGKASGWAMDTSLADCDASFLGEVSGDGAGNCVSGAGDVNGDGYDDFLIGAWANDEAADNAGQAYLILGKSSGWAMDTSLGDSDASFWGEREGSTVSWGGLSGAGDVNADGYDDFIVGAYADDEPGDVAGQTYLILGRASGWAMDTSLADSDASFWGEAPDDRAGQGVSGGGDVNGDGYDDFLISGYLNDEGGDNAGQIYLIFGKSSGWAMDTELYDSDASFWGEAADDHAGGSVSAVGDFNGDGGDDLLIAAYSNSEAAEDAGQAYLIFGESAVGPELSDPTYSPESGRTDTNFTFTVHYYHAGGQAPDTIQVFVNAPAHDMTLDSGSADDGVYAWTGTIPEEGQAQYHFEAQDTYGRSARLPESGELDGPMVYDDYVKPSSSCTAPEGTTTSTITVDYDSSDDNSGVKLVTLYYQFDGGGYVDSGYSSGSAAGSFSVTLTDGNGVYDFYTIAEDNAANVEDAPGAPDATTTFDDVPPTSSAGADEYCNATPIAVDFTADDALSGVATTRLWYSFDGGTWTDSGLAEPGGAGTFDFNAPDGDGSYDLYTVCTDNCGNVEDPPGAPDCTVSYDCTKPQSSCSCVDSTNGTSVEVGFTASDNYQVDDVTLWYSFEGGTWTDTGQTESGASGSFTYVFTDGSGVYGFYTIARDMVGNVEDPPASADCTVNADFTMPQSSCWADDYTASVPFDVQFAASDGGSGVAETRLYYRFGGESAWVDSYLVETGESGTFQLDPTVLTPQFGDGDYELMTRATDNVGNVEPPPASPDDTITLDRTAPVSSCDAEAEYTSAATVTIDFSASDALTGIALVRLFVSRDDSDWEYTGQQSDQAAGDFVYDFAGLDGTFRFVTVATDGAGNVEEISAARACTVVRDTGLPTSVSEAPELSNDASFDVDFEITDAVSGGYGVQLYARFSTDGTASCADDWEYTGLYETGEFGSLTYAPPYGTGFYEFFTIARDNAGNFEAMKDTADCSTEYNPDYALSSCWAASEASAATVAVSFEVDVGQAGFDHVELWYKYSEDCSDWPENWTDGGITSDAEAGTLVFEAAHRDGCYRFCTIALNENMLAELFPSVCDCQTRVDGTLPTSALSGPGLAGSVPVTLSYDASDLSGEGTFCSGVACVEVWYSLDDETPVLYERIELAPATVATGSIQFSPAQEGVYDLWSIAIDAFGNYEEAPAAADLTLTVDLTAPISSAGCDSFGVAFPIAVTFAASDTLTEVVTVDLWVRYESGDWEDTGLSGSEESGTLYYTPDTAQEGTYYFYTVATDEAGHVEAAPDTPDDQMMIDWTAPQTSCTSPPYTSDPTISLTYTATDAMSGMQSVSAWVKIGDDAWLDTGQTGPADGGVIGVDVSAWAEGTFGLCTRGCDNSGNIEDLPDTAPTTTVYDATAPVSAAGLPAEGVLANTTPIDVPYTANDALSGLESVELWFSFDSGDWESSGLSDTPSALSMLAEGNFSFVPPHGDGTYDFATVAADNAGNREILPDSPDGGALVFDQTSPASSVSYGSVYASEFPFTLPFTAADTTSGVANVALFVSINGSAYSDTGLSASGEAGAFEFTPDVIADGVYCFYSVATDNAGNVESAPDEPDATVIFDLDAPVSEADVDSEYSNAFPVRVSYSASDTASGLARVRLWVSFNGGAFADSGLSSGNATGTFIYTSATPADGRYEFYTVASDHAGNVEAAPLSADAWVVVDGKKPTSSCSIAATMTNTFPIPISYTSSDAASGVERVKLYYRVNNGAWLLADTLSEPNGSYDFTPAPVRDGYFEFYTKAYDRAANAESTSGADVAITVDRTPPTSSASSPSAVQDAPFNVSFTAQDDRSGVANTTLWYQHNSGDWLDSGLDKTGTAGQFEFSAPAGKGTYGFYTICTDIAGNVEAAPSVADATSVYSVPTPDILADKSSLDFGQVNVGEEGSDTLTITNVGDADLTIENISTDDPVFVAAFEGSLPIALGPSGSLEIEVVFSPDEEGVFDAALTIASDDPDTPSLAVDLSGEGVEIGGELTVGVSTNAETYEFSDTLDVEISMLNTDETVTVDIYLVLTYDLGGPDERHWSASMTEVWTDGLAPLVTGFEVPDGFALGGYPWWSSELPCEFPMIAKSGTYTLRMAAVEPGTLDLVSNLAIADFILTGEPFVNVSTDKATYALDGDTVVISLDVDVPYDLTADVYVLMLAPDGQFWSPTGFGEATWVADIGPMFSSITLDGGFTFSGPAFVASLPADAPFNSPGQFMLFAALAVPGTLTPLSDIGTAIFALR